MGNNLEFRSWSKELSEEVNEIGLEYIWQDPQENSVSRTCKIIKKRCCDAERQNLFYCYVCDCTGVGKDTQFVA
jgi:hypothetical protein